MKFSRSISWFLLAAAIAAGCAPRTSEVSVPRAVVPDSALVVDTVLPANVMEGDFIVQSGEARLAGTLTLPADARGPMPVALIVAGSGPTDRNGNNPPLLRTNTYAQLAWGLARHGIASLRYDKRGVRGSAMRLDPTLLTTDDFMEDAAAAAHALDQDPRFSHVILIGHSEGAQLVLQAANRGAPAAGVAMISGVGRPLAVVLREQVARMLDGADLERFDAALDRYLRGDPAGSVPPAVAPLFLAQNQRFLRSMADYDPQAEMERATVPILIVHGRRDLQVSDADAEALSAARPDAGTLILPKANHILKRTDEDTPTGQLPTYRDPNLPIDPFVVPGLVNWIRSVIQ
jgi:uncharacterized protein